jgi:hypothetical protein
MARPNDSPGAHDPDPEHGTFSPLQVTLGAL